MRPHHLKITFGVFLILLFIQVGDASKQYDFGLIEIENIARYDEDRVAYQQIEIDYEDFTHNMVDNSIATLMVIRDKKIYLFKDGYDSASDVIAQKRILEMENRLLPDLWLNKIDGKPDFIRITDRRVELLKQVKGIISYESAGMTFENTNKDAQKENKGDNLNDEFSGRYINIRNHFIKTHIDIFRSLFINRKEANLQVNRKPIRKSLAYSGHTLFFTSVTGKTLDGKLYYAEDSDGDGITETVMVSIPDGFHWGYKSGPNILFIYKNKQKDISEYIKNLTTEAFYGTEEEQAMIKKTFGKEDEMKTMINDLYKIDAENQKLIDSIKKEK